MSVSILSSLLLELSAEQPLKARKPWKMLGCRFFLPVATIFIISGLSAEGRKMDHCEVARELQRAGIVRTFISNWVCLMIHESDLETTLLKGPGKAASYSHGIFQISSYYSRYCIRGRKGGLCNEKCENFTDNDITDDIACAQKIFRADGFKVWDGWVKNCKNQSPLVDVSGCFRR